MLHMPVDVIATFNVQGKIKPNFIRLEDEYHVLQTYKIENIIFSREEKYAGIPVILFNSIMRDGCISHTNKISCKNTSMGIGFRLNVK